MSDRRHQTGRVRRLPAETPRTPGATLTPARIAEMQSDFDSNARYKTIQNAVTEVSVNSLANRRDVLASADHSFSVHLDDWAVTSQGGSGRCWMFAGLNLLRVGAMKKMKLKDFEFSQNFTLFWDKLEKANLFLEAIIETADLSADDRTVAHLLNDPIGDGGQWNMFVNIVNKYGLAPKTAMPETESSSNTPAMNGVLLAKLREAAKTLRDLHAQGRGKAIPAAKLETMRVIHRILCIHLGTPPARFDWQWKDEKKKFHRRLNMTPHAFAAEFVTLPVDDYVCLVNDPRRTSPYGRTFTVKYLGNVVEGGIARYLNIEMKLMKQIAMETLQAGEPVWFGCDVGKQMHRDAGVLDAELRDYEGVYDTKFDLDKEGRLLYGQTRMTHAMLFTGVDILRGKPRRWRIENSWGDKGGKKGFYLMNDSWFDEHMFEIAARKKHLPAALRAALDLEPIVLPPWDPMGSLARA